MKIALVHDDFIQLGGAERLFQTIAQLFPDTTIFTSVVNWSKLPSLINRRRIKPSFMQGLPYVQKYFRAYLPMYPFAFENMNFSNYDLVISSTTRFTKAIITHPKTIHVCYINSLPRFLYEEEKADQYLSPLVREIMFPYFSWLKRWDKVSASRVDYYIANSKNVQQKIKKNYFLDSAVIHPFADTDFFIPVQNRKKQHYLIVSRLVKWKRIDIAIKAARDLNLKLKIVGSGPDKKRLKRFSSSKIEFLGSVSKEELKSLYQNAKALIVTQDEDFGISAVEAQACATPVIALNKGGATETIINKKTGVLFDCQTAESLKDAINVSSRLKYNKSEIRKNALRFTKKNFEKKFKETIESYVKPA